MDTQIKDQIASEAKVYMTSKEMSQAGFARYCGVSPAYMSDIMNGRYTHSSGDKEVEIGDRYFETIAGKIGMQLIVSYWRTQNTRQFSELIYALDDAKRRGVAKMVIGETGCGKTFAADRFVENNPLNTYRVTVSNMHKIQDVIEEVGDALGIKGLRADRRKVRQVGKITQRLRDIYLSGGRPLLVFDEAENLTVAMIGLMKGLYDAVNKFSGLVLIGTDELELKLDRLARRQLVYGGGIPQFQRRFKAGTVRISPIDRGQDFEQFLAEISDYELRKILRGLCANYGELHDYLEPALRSASSEGVMLTDRYFREMYNLH